MKKQQFILNEDLGYFQHHGVDVMAFDDIYPEGHQSGLSIIMHGQRVASNGDIRFEPTPGQWQPVPKLLERRLDAEKNSISARLSFPDPARHLKGMNPMIYPDFEFSYDISIVGQEADICVSVSLNRPIPEKYAGKICFNLELIPCILFGKAWIMDDKSGVFPPQANGPVLAQNSNHPHIGAYEQSEPKADPHMLSSPHPGYSPIVADDLLALPYATGRKLTICPDEALRRLVVESHNSPLKLLDGRLNHNNGWFVISSEIPSGATKNAIVWTIRPNAVADWLYGPTVQASQVGYHPAQPKMAVIELDKRSTQYEKPVIYRIGENGPEKVFDADATDWGTFLRYKYLRLDFSALREEGLYQIAYATAKSDIFRIAPDVYERGVWQPVIEYFLPVQMCHMLVREKYRIWHGLCHQDDAKMAPTNLNHFDGYVQGPSTLTRFAPGDSVPGLNVGGWHDAGDFDLRIESQLGEAYILAMTYETFGTAYDATTIDQDKRLVEIHQPDGKNDILQQIEHGALSVVSAYESLGRLYRGIIEGDLRQYVLLGDAAVMTNAIKGDADDRLVFTEDNPWRELQSSARLAAISRALVGFNDALAAKALTAAKEIYAVTHFDETKAHDTEKNAKIHAAAELYLATGDDEYRNYLLNEQDFIVAQIEEVAWIIGRVEQALSAPGFSAAIRQALPAFRQNLDERSGETPYGIPYRPFIWGAGWGIQRMGFQHYFLHAAWPDVFAADLVFNALNFILGCHPGSNNASFASGIGTKSATVAYGANRADYSYIPGGVVSGTALIRPDFPELLEFPYLWQQTEYVMGGGSTHFMFLVLAARRLLGEG